MAIEAGNVPAERSARSGDCVVVVFTRNEEGLPECIESILASEGSFISRITIVVNGSSGSFVREARRLKARYGGILRVFEIPFGDKSHAWNQYIYGVNEDHDFHGFVDAYVRVKPDAIPLLVRALERNGRAVGLRSQSVNLLLPLLGVEYHRFVAGEEAICGGARNLRSLGDIANRRY
jgi:glycosyltransferase involved in cell wall biosynthesis